MKILYATDGGAPAKQALALLERVAAPEKTDVTVLTVGRSVKSMVEPPYRRATRELNGSRAEMVGLVAVSFS
jgi:nucleotide-binding universal stress UspA family protein